MNLPPLSIFPLINVVISSCNYRCTCSFHFLFLPSGSAFHFPPCLLSARACMHANMQGQRPPPPPHTQKNTLTNYHRQQSLANLFLNGWVLPAPSICSHTITIVSHPATPPPYTSFMSVDQFRSSTPEKASRCDLTISPSLRTICAHDAKFFEW